jgi:hypothetical protein
VAAFHTSIDNTNNEFNTAAMHRSLTHTVCFFVSWWWWTIASDVAAAQSIPTSVPPPTTIPINPAQLGNYTTRRLKYNLTDISFNALLYFPFVEPEQVGNLSLFQGVFGDFPLEVLAEVTEPVGVSPAVQLPLVLVLHGQFATCYFPRMGTRDPGSALEEWPCTFGRLPLPSYLGFRYLADVLASQGYLVVSIAANGIYAVQQAPRSPEVEGLAARSRLLRHHLQLWATWNAAGGDPWGGRFRGRVDINQVVLVGHKRGGQAIHRAVIDASSDGSAQYQIVGLVALGPSATDYQVSPDVHSATIIPTCNNDRENWYSQAAYVDASRDIARSEALRSAVMVIGANNQYFNSEWSPNQGRVDWNRITDFMDDSFDGPCSRFIGQLRISAEQQQTVAAVYTAALVELAINQDAKMLPLLDGSYVRPEAVGQVNVTTSAVGGARNRLLYRPQRLGTPLLHNGMGGGECFSAQAPLCNDETFTFFDVTPHWQLPELSFYSPPKAQALELKWNRTGASAEFVLLVSQSNLTRLDRLDVRIANFNLLGASFELVLSDGSGKNATLPSNLTTIEGWPQVEDSTFPVRRVQARTLRGSLRPVRSLVNLSNITAVHLIARSDSGRVWVLDIAASQAKVVKPTILNLPVVSIATAQVLEGSGVQHYNVSITSDRPFAMPGSVWIENDANKFQVAIAQNASGTVASVPFSWVGDSKYDPVGPYENIRIFAVRGVRTSTSFGKLTVYEDDIPPVLSVVSRNVTALEGKSLVWTLTTSYAFDEPTEINFFFIAPPSNETEMTTGDVTASWLQSLGVTPPASPIPLSQIVAFPFALALFERNATSANVTIPIRNDGVAEGDEVAILRPFYRGNQFVTESIVALTGRVRAHTA